MATNDLQILLLFGGLLVGVFACLVFAGGALLWAAGKILPRMFGAPEARKAAKWLLLGAPVMLLLAPFLAIAPIVLLPGAERYLPRVAERGDVLVAAIDAFEREHGEPPSALEELIPVHLTAIPDTGYPGDGEWEYRCGEGKWSLCVPIYPVLPVIDFDEYRYSPHGEPKGGYRGWTRHGNWLYLDE